MPPSMRRHLRLANKKKPRTMCGAFSWVGEVKSLMG